MDKAPRHPAAGRSASAIATFEAIAIGISRRPPADAIKELVLHDLIVPAGPKAWEVPTRLHIAWCEWCSAQERRHG